MIEYLLVIIALFIVFLLFKIVRKTISLFITVTTVIGIALLILGFFALQDAMEFKENFADEKNIFVLAENNTYHVAVVLNIDGKNSTLETFEDTDIIETYIEEGIPDEYYKIFIIEKQALENSDLESVNIGIGELSKEETIEALYSEEPVEVVAEAIAEQEKIPSEVLEQQVNEYFKTQDELKSQLFVSSIIPIFGSEPISLITGVQRGNIIIQPETLMFKTIKYIPGFIFEKVDEAVNNTKED